MKKTHKWLVYTDKISRLSARLKSALPPLHQNYTAVIQSAIKPIRVVFMRRRCLVVHAIVTAVLVFVSCQPSSVPYYPSGFNPVWRFTRCIPLVLPVALSNIPWRSFNTSRIGLIHREYIRASRERMHSTTKTPRQWIFSLISIRLLSL